MRKQVIIFSLLLYLISVSKAQSDVDALRYSLPAVQGTARNMALGNTMGSIGAEVSTLSTNPAGIAKFSSAEFTFSSAVVISNTQSEFFGNTTKDNKTKYQVTNFGIVLASKISGNKWNNLKFGFGLNRLANFNDNYYFSGYNSKNSLLNSYYEDLDNRDYITDSTDAATKYPFGASIAYRLGLVTIDTLGNTYTATNNGNMQQSFNIEKSGGMNELAIGAGSMYKEKLMVGASIGIPIVNYKERIWLSENDVLDSAYDLNSFLNETYLKTAGSGFNLKIGIIGMPVTNLRLSFAFQTPGILFLHDEFYTYMEADYASQPVIYTGTSPDGISKYKYVQPWKMTTGASYTHKYGLIAVEYELSDAGGSKFNLKTEDISAGNYEDYINNQIKEKYGVFHTIKAGVEFKYDPIRIRGGIQYRTSPFKDIAAPSGVNTSSLTYSAGFGYRGKHFFADIAYVQNNFKEMFIPYRLKTESWQPDPTAILHTKKHAIVFTLGYKL